MLIPDGPAMDCPTFGQTVENLCQEFNVAGDKLTPLIADVVMSANRVEVVYVHENAQNADERKLREDVLPKAVVEYAHANDVDLQNAEPVLGHLALCSSSLGAEEILSVLRSTKRLQLGLRIAQTPSRRRIVDTDAIG